MGVPASSRGARRWLIRFTLPSIAGGIVGAQLLLHTSAARFDAIVPFLVLGATVLFLLQQPLSRRLVRRAPEEQDAATALPRPSAWFLAGQFAVAVYGGYFGAGIGILMLATLGAMGLTDIHRMNGLKNWGAMCINAVAAATFVVSGIVTWPVAARWRRADWSAATAAHGWPCASGRRGSAARSSPSGCWRSSGCWRAGDTCYGLFRCSFQARRSILEAHDVRCHAAFAVHGACGGPTRRRDGTTTRRKYTEQNINGSPPGGRRRGVVGAAHSNPSK